MRPHDPHTSPRSACLPSRLRHDGWWLAAPPSQREEKSEPLRHILQPIRGGNRGLPSPQDPQALGLRLVKLHGVEEPSF